MDHLESLFARHRLRLTAPRRALFQLLESFHEPVEINQIIQHIKQGDRTSVYRNLDVFISLGVVSIIPLGWKKRYELAAPFAPHHHHLQCKQCDELVAIDTPRLERVIADIALEHGYELTQHHIELTGVCSRCKKVNSPTP